MVYVVQAELQTLTVVNSDLQRKLESQTQRLELAIQQQAHASPHAAFSSSSSSVFINGSALHAMRPQLQLSAQTKQPQPGAQWQPSGGLEAASNGGEQTVEEQFSELPPGHGSQYVRSAPPTPQQVAHRPLRAPRGKSCLSTIMGFCTWPGHGDACTWLRNDGFLCVWRCACVCVCACMHACMHVRTWPMA